MTTQKFHLQLDFQCVITTDIKSSFNACHVTKK